MEDIHLSKAEFKELLNAPRPSGMIRIKYDPDNSLHSNIVEGAVDAGLLEAEPSRNDVIQFSADFNIFMMNADDFEIVEEGSEDPGAAEGGRRKRKSVSRLNKKTRRSKRK